MFAHTRLLAALAGTSLLLAGCGGPALPSGISGLARTSSLAPPRADIGTSGGNGSAGSGFVFDSDCMGVISAYTSIAMAMVPSLTGSATTYSSDQVVQAISGLGGKVPDELKPDFQTLSGAAKTASGKPLVEAGTILGTDAVSAASDHISAWTTKHCGS